MFFLTRTSLYAKRELETTLLKRRLRHLDDRNYDLQLRDQLALSKLHACYARALASSAFPLQTITAKHVKTLIDVQLKPKTVFFNSPHQLHKQFILEKYPRVPTE